MKRPHPSAPGSTLPDSGAPSRRGPRTRTATALLGAFAALPLVVAPFAAVPLALAAPGDLDGTFGTSGVALRATGSRGAQAAVLQADGKVVTASLDDTASDRASLLLVRFTTTGAVDTTFGSSGVASVSVAVDSLSTVRAMLRQANDNRFVVAGRSIDQFALVRLTTAGALDNSFGTSGVAKVKVSGDDEAFALAQQADSKIVAAGSADDGIDADFAVVRLTTAGAADATFSGDGIATVEFGGDDRARAVAMSGDNIVVAGVSSGDIAVARLTPNGALDTSFSTDGKVTTSVSAGVDAAWAVLVQGDGKVVVAGEADGDFVLVRYTAAGALDTGFGTGGIARKDVSPGEIDKALALVRQADNKLVVAGDASPSTAGDLAVLRYTTGGQPDTTFGGGDGVVTTSVAATFDEDLRALLLQADGKVVAAGLSEDGSTSYQVLVRYLSDGTVPVVVCGDADGNDAINSSDALRVLRKAVGQDLTCPSTACDVDSSGAINSSDALRVLRKAVGQDVVLTCPAS